MIVHGNEHTCHFQYSINRNKSNNWESQSINTIHSFGLTQFQYIWVQELTKMSYLGALTSGITSISQNNYDVCLVCAIALGGPDIDICILGPN